MKNPGNLYWIEKDAIPEIKKKLEEARRARSR
jgi:hypothetical protein